MPFPIREDMPPPGAPPWLVHIYRMGGIRPGESEYDFVQRRGRESRARHERFMIEVERHRAERRARGEPEPQGEAPALPRGDGIVGRPRW